MRKYKVIITGGHHNSALVVARELVRLGHQVSWLGHRQAATGDTHDSAEYLEVSSAGIPFYDLRAGKLGSRPSLQNILNIPLGLLRAHRLLVDLKPDLVLSFGSYLGFTVALVAYLHRLPIYLHEQTVVAGRANKLISRLARRVYLTWESSKRYFPTAKSLVVGLPLRPSLLHPKRVKLFDNSLPTILVLGGKQGSHEINKLIFANLEALLGKYNLVHQTGNSSVTADYQTAISLLDSLPRELSSHYRPEGYIGESEIGSLLTSCDLYLGRSGAHITYELGLLGKSAVLIPYLYTHSREQLKNAHFLKSAGLATIIPSSKLSFSLLLVTLTTQLANNSPKPLLLPQDATSRLIEDLLHAQAL